MPDISGYIQGDGVINADTSQILTEVQNEWTAALGTSLSLDPSTPQGRMIEVQTAGRKFALTLCASVANQINPNYATGQFLDALAALFGVTRFSATNTIVYADITGLPGTVLAPGIQVQTTAGDLFFTQQTVTIGSSGTVSGVPFYSVELGPIPCPAGTLNTITTPTPGLETVNNPAGPAVVGTVQESDSDLRSRMLNSRYSGTSLPEAIQSGINKLSDVVDYWFYNNGQGESVTQNGVSVDAHSIILVIQGGDDNEIAQTLFNLRSAGCGFTAISGQSTTVNITDGAGAFRLSYPITFNRPQAVPIDCTVTVLMNTYTGSSEELTAAVQSALETWAAGGVAGVDRPRIGGTVYTYEIGAAVSAQIPEIIIQNVTIGAAGETQGSTPISATAAQIVTLNNITVTINT